MMIMTNTIIDCARCEVRGVGCDDCVVQVLLAEDPAEAGWLTAEEALAVDNLSRGGLLPPLRLCL